MATQSENLNSITEDFTDADALRKRLEGLRVEAEQEIQRLSRQLAERETETQNSVASVTERLALQQEMTVLRQTLSTKEEALDHITNECRRLEDEIEDQNIAYDGLKQEIERRENSLQDSYAEVERLRRLLNEVQKKFDAQEVITTPISSFNQPRSGRGWWMVGVVISSILLSLGLSVLFVQVWNRLDWHPGNLFTSAVNPGSSGPVESNNNNGISNAPAAAITPTQSHPAVKRDRLRTGGLAPALAVLPGNSFQMGNNSLSGEDFSPAHQVRLGSYLIGLYEITYQEYDQFTRATGRTLLSDDGWGRGNQPVIGVTWGDAQAYVDWLSRETGQNYRLPTEAEWEYAARAGGGSYWWGFNQEPGHAVCFDCGSRWDRRSPAPVGSFPANPFGLFDTAGNVMEWVDDCYHPNYHDAPKDGSSWFSEGCSERVARGGAFNKPSTLMRTYARAHFAPDTSLNMLGFRVARDL